MRFTHSDALNACPRLRGRAQGPVSAVCVPVTFMGRALGVLHASAPADQPIGDAQFDRITALGVQFGGRIGTVRAFERTQLQAATDALTGLANRRTVEKRLRELALHGEPHVVVMVDLDHFKRLNDTHGHPAGDDALRVFAEVARSSMRETDLPGRWGGEEFAFVLPGMDEQEAAAWVERVRERLQQTLLQRGTPVFTASFGIAASSLAGTPDALVRLADEALYRAKRDGRDRAATATSGDTVVPLRRESEHRSAVDVRLLADNR
jgi:diguanylate cyclase (GGDEF)-like protein